MPLRTTLIGSYPKPSYVKTPDWFKNPDMKSNMDEYNKQTGVERDRQYQTALREVIEEQIDSGVDVITDGELLRESYYLHLCRHLQGFDFINYEMKSIRNNACSIATPVIVGKIDSQETFAWKEWKKAQKLSRKPVKYTIPGPMTILNSTTNKFYTDMKEASQDLVKVINREILDLIAHGCRYVQLDEPLMVRDIDIALSYGIKHAEQCFQNVNNRCEKTVHICCGYPSYIDQMDYPKADPECYQMLAEQLDESIFDCVSIEDAHRKNDLKLFEKFNQTTLITGVVDVSRSRVESVEEIRARVEEILQVFPRERLVLAPDCGLGFLADKEIRMKKLQAMVTVAKEF